MIPIATAVAGVVVGALAMWVKGKQGLHSIRDLVDEVDNAVKDDKVSEDEFRKIWDKAKGVFGKNN